MTTSVLRLVVAALITSGCAATIPNTTVEDTQENRQVVAFLEQYRHAVEGRDVRRLLEMASPRYLDDNGTPGGADDLDFDSLREKLSSWRDRVVDVRYEIKYRRVTYDQDKITIEFRYTASFRVVTADGSERWSRRLGDHRLVITRMFEEEGSEAESDEEFLVLSGM